MARLPLNQTSLHEQSRRLAAYRRFLPAVDLKRRQLIAERNRAARELDAERRRLRRLLDLVAAELPMLADETVEPEGLVELSGSTEGEENRMGVRLPVLEAVRVDRHPYALLGRPHWTDRLVELLADAVELELRCRYAERRLQLLADAVRKSTQRFNLFDKVLIPRARANIRRIQLFLADQSRAAVVRAKLAKTRREGSEA